MTTINKESDLISLLREMPIDTWSLRDSVVLDWHDGEIHAVYEMLEPTVSFVLLQIGYQESNGLILERLYKVDQIASGTVEQLKEIIEKAGDDSAVLNSRIDSLLSSGVEVPVIIQTGPDGKFSNWWLRTYS